VLVSRSPGRYPPMRSAPPAALTVRKVRLLRVFICPSLCAGRAMDRTADALIGAASADVARHGGVDSRVRGFRFLREQRGARHELSRLAVTTLRHLLGNPGRL